MKVQERRNQVDQKIHCVQPVKSILNRSTREIRTYQHSYDVAKSKQFHFEFVLRRRRILGKIIFSFF